MNFLGKAPMREGRANAQTQNPTFDAANGVRSGPCVQSNTLLLPILLEMYKWPEATGSLSKIC